jgi:hypothetical protein
VVIDEKWGERTRSAGRRSAKRRAVRVREGMMGKEDDEKDENYREVEGKVNKRD